MKKKNKILKASCSTKKSAPVKVTSNSSTNDFDSFLLDFDQQKKESSVQMKQKIKEIKQKNHAQTEQKKLEKINYKATNSTDFDKFLTEFDSKPKTLKPPSKQSKIAKLPISKPTSNKTKNTQLNETKNSLNDSVIDQQLNDFDNFLSEFDSPVTKKPSKQNTVSKSPKKHASAKATTSSFSSSSSNLELSSNKSSIDKISFMKLIEESDEDEAITTDSDLTKMPRSSRTIEKPSLKNNNNEDPNDISGYTDIQFDDADDDDLKNDPDYDKLSEKSEASDVEYVTDDEDSIGIIEKKSAAKCSIELVAMTGMKSCIWSV